ncbi:MAG: D-tyrosyl-tRNA(Tyr) deacylase [Desulfobacterales bacterium]|nr:D-tyrosyl-tRNA(Tyr) deacylase [Desulfobacterales bacterium]MCP4159161.1 D-tyrosyl-tRNA(Tyr) deacylase [Deltaproteobacteria bacterium]
MKAVIQRVKESDVKVDGEMISKISEGLLVLLGVDDCDVEKDADYLAEKIVNLRIFEDANGKMNLSLKDISGDMLVVSQFTLIGDCKKGRRPSFAHAAKPEKADSLYQHFMEKVKEQKITVDSGKFRAMMDVSLINHGPVTFILDSR